MTLHNKPLVRKVCLVEPWWRRRLSCHANAEACHCSATAEYITTGVTAVRMVLAVPASRVPQLVKSITCTSALDTHSLAVCKAGASLQQAQSLEWKANDSEIVRCTPSYQGQALWLATHHPLDRSAGPWLDRQATAGKRGIGCLDLVWDALAIT